jgi:hypothetical protein
VICWNCGKEGHTLTQCRNPRNQDAINANKRKYQRKPPVAQANTAATPTELKDSGKFRPPEANENNRRVINNKHMFYNKRTQRWVPDSTHPSNKPSNAPTMAANNATAPQQATSTTPQTKTTAQAAALANATRAIETALQGLVNQFH